MLPSLFKMTNSGAIQQWDVKMSSDEKGDYYQVIHGQLDGKMQSSRTYITEGKNVGKKNETSPSEQCELEAKSEWNKKVDRKGYTLEIPTEKPKLPMLAKTYKKDGKHIKWSCAVQPKLDGIKCTACLESGKVVLRSRTNKVFSALSHIEEALKLILKEGVTLDGELYNHDFRDDFQTLVSGIKRDKPTEHTHLIQYHVYDQFSDKDFDERMEELSHFIPKSGVVQLVPTLVVKTEKEFLEIYQRIISEGFEGAMLRNLKGPYKVNGRSKDLQKYKEFDDDEFEIIGAKHNRGKAFKQCSFVCKTKDGKEFDVKPKGTEAQREQYWTDWRQGRLEVGAMMTVKYFGLSNDGIPRFPIGVAIRQNY